MQSKVDAQQVDAKQSWSKAKLMQSKVDAKQVDAKQDEAKQSWCKAISNKSSSEGGATDMIFEYTSWCKLRRSWSKRWNKWKRSKLKEVHAKEVHAKEVQAKEVQAIGFQAKEVKIKWVANRKWHAWLFDLNIIVEVQIKFMRSKLKQSKFMQKQVEAKEVRAKDIQEMEVQAKEIQEKNVQMKDFKSKWSAYRQRYGWMFGTNIISVVQVHRKAMREREARCWGKKKLL